jgi:hypothetical protein
VSFWLSAATFPHLVIARSEATRQSQGNEDKEIATAFGLAMTEWEELKNSFYD